MHSHSIESFQHEHVFLGARHDRNAKRVWIVVGLTAVMMVGEIVGGTVFGSLALVADGWHMSTHAAALTISALAYSYARRHVHDDRFAFGTGKLGDLASFASAIVLGMIALLIGYESVQRLLNPVAIWYDEAIAIAVLGLCVNLAERMASARRSWARSSIIMGMTRMPITTGMMTMMAMTTIITTTTTSISARPMFMSSRMP